MTSQPGAAAHRFIGEPVSRVDGRLKVTGAATYAGEFDPGPDLSYGVIVSSTIAGGRITDLDTSAAEAAAGVVAVLSHRNAPRLPYLEHKALVDPAVGERMHVLQDDRVRHQGQIVALVIAETFEQATYAASLVRMTCAEEPAVTSFDDAAAKSVPPGPAWATSMFGYREQFGRGDPDAAMTTAPVRIDAEYVIPRENHNPIELPATIASWHGDQLTLWDKSQWVDNVRDEIAAVFGIPTENIRVISPFVGGAFGSHLRTWPHVTLAALAAREVRRPVKLVLTRRQMFHLIGYRPHTVQRVALGADHDGRLIAIRHEGVAETSTYEEYAENLLNPSRYLYSCPNVATRYRFAPRHVQTPTSMRAPGEVSGIYALECAMDELATALGIDPVELRLRNEADRDEDRELPFSSRSLQECFRLASERFGWDKRNPEPGSMRDAQGRLVGYGCSAATYPVLYLPASARAILSPDGTAVVSSASSDMGPGTYTSMTQVAAETLGLPLHRVRFELGDTDLPRAAVHGGSLTMASIGSAVQAACREAVRLAHERAGVTGPGSDPGIDIREVMQRIGQPVEATVANDPGDESTRYSMHSFGALFAEVSVDPDLGLVRVPRIVGAYGIGRVVNPKTAHSQCIGGMVMGIGMALLEQTVVDPRNARPVNSNLADYHVPVNADIHQLDVSFVDEHDPHVNPLGAKGAGELATIGVAPAIANAVYHATGRRVRDLPITAEQLLRLAQQPVDRERRALRTPPAH